MSRRRALRNQALSLSQKAFEALMADPKRAQWVAEALGRVQRGKRALDRGQEEVMRAFQLAVRSEYRAVGKQLSGLKRRTRELEERVDRLLGPKGD